MYGNNNTEPWPCRRGPVGSTKQNNKPSPVGPEPHHFHNAIIIIILEYAVKFAGKLSCRLNNQFKYIVYSKSVYQYLVQTSCWLTLTDRKDILRSRSNDKIIDLTTLLLPLFVFLLSTTTCYRYPEKEKKITILE